MRRREEREREREEAEEEREGEKEIALLSALAFAASLTPCLADNDKGQLGTGNTNAQSSPVLIPILGCEYAVDIAAGAFHSLVLSENGEVYSFGEKEHAQLARRTLETYDAWEARSVDGLISKGLQVFASGNCSYVVCGEDIGKLGDARVTSCVETNSAILLTRRGQGNDTTASVWAFSPHTGSCRWQVSDQDAAALSAAALTSLSNSDNIWAYHAASCSLTLHAPKAFLRHKDLPSLGGNVADSLATDSCLLFPCISLNTTKDAEASPFTVGSNIFCIMNALSSGTADRATDDGALNASALVVDDYQRALRFPSTGGGWGYSGGSIDAIGFEVNQEVRE